MSLGYFYPPGPCALGPAPVVGYPYAQGYYPYPYPYPYPGYAYPCAVPAVPVYTWPSGYVQGYPYAWTAPPAIPVSPTDTRPLVPVVSALFLRLSDEMHAHLGPAPPQRDGFASLAWPRRPPPFPSLDHADASASAPRHPRRLERRADDSIELNQFSTFVHKVLSQTVVTPNTLFHALFYSVKMLHIIAPCTEQGHELDEQSNQLREQFASHFLAPRPMTPYRLLLVGLSLANKLLDDHPFHTNTWEEVGMEMQLARLEREALSVMHYDLVPQKEEWDLYLSHLEKMARHPEGVLALVPKPLLTLLETAVASLRCPLESFVTPEEEDVPGLMSSSSSLTSSGISSPTGSPALTSSDPGSPLYIYS